MKKDKHIQLLNKFLDGESDLNEKNQLNSLLDNPRVFDEWMYEQWNNSSDEMDDRVEKKIYDVVSNERKTKKNILFSHFWKIASMLLLIVSLGLSFLVYEGQAFNDSEEQQWTVRVEKGQKANLTLPDGTNVWLNSDSKITYNASFNQQNRNVGLEGEAYFEVAKAENNPFIVHTRQMSVRAVGTTFNVKAYSDDADVITTLISGKVRVNTPVQSQLLEPNQRLVYNKEKGKVSVSDEQDIESFSAWRENQLIFNQHKFKSIAKVLERHYNIRFVFENSQLEEFCFSGTIPNTSLESLLEIFTLTSPVSYRIDGSVIYLGVNEKTNQYYNKILRLNN